MKKIFIIFLIFLFSFSSVFAYNPTKKDKILLNKVYNIIDKKFNTNKKRKKLIFVIKRLENKYKFKSKKMYFLLLQIEKYLQKKLNKNTFKSYKYGKYGGNNLVVASKIKKVFDKVQDAQIKRELKKKKKNLKNKKKGIASKIKIDFDKKFEEQKKLKFLQKIKKNWDKKNLKKLVIQNGVVIKYVKKQKNKELKTLVKDKEITIPKIEKFLVKKIGKNNEIVLSYYKNFVLFKLTGIEDYSCDKQKLNNFLKNNLEGKKFFLDNIKKKNSKILKGEIIFKAKKLSQILKNKEICKIKK